MVMRESRILRPMHTVILLAIYRKSDQSNISPADIPERNT